MAVGVGLLGCGGDFGGWLLLRVINKNKRSILPLGECKARDLWACFFICSCLYISAVDEASSSASSPSLNAVYMTDTCDFQL